MKHIIDFGLSKEEFLSQVVDRRMHIKRGALPPSLIQWAHLNDALGYVDPMPPHVRIHHHHGLVPEADYVEDHVVAGVASKRLKTAAVQRMLEKGATVVLNRLEARFALMGRLCAEVSRFTDAATLANGYLAFSGKGSFGKHWDTHDVMALQLIGRKRWRVYEPTFPFPLSGQTSKNRKHECPAEPVFDGILEAGDLMYLPRGWWHEATPIGETFHVAIGVHMASVVHFVAWLCENALRDHEVLRRTLRPGGDAAGAVLAAVGTVEQLMRDPRQLEACLAMLKASVAVAPEPFRLQDLVSPLNVVQPTTEVA